MLGSLRGQISGHLEQKILLEVNGVGYWVHTGSWQPDGEVVCYIHHHLREDASDLYGFRDLETLALFEKLISVSGVGPKAGLALLSLGSVSDLKEAIAEGKTAYLSSAPGIGQKVAQRLIIELKGKLPVSALFRSPEENQAGSEVEAALENLGYRKAEIQKVVSKMPKDIETVDSKLRWSLQQLSK